MKSILITNRKGGVGKSAIASQFAHYLADKLQLRVLFIDLDSQRNSTKALTTKQAATLSVTNAAEAFTDRNATVEAGRFVVMPGSDELDLLDMEKERRNELAGNFKSFIARIGEQFDICVIDTAPTHDIRMKSAIISADFLVAPTQLAQEAIDGIRFLVQSVTFAKGSLNPNLTFIGILPNQVMDTPFHRENLAIIVQHFAKLLIALPNGGFALIRRTTAIEESQAEGVPIWKHGKTSARDAWRRIEPSFAHIAATMGVLDSHTQGVTHHGN